MQVSASMYAKAADDWSDTWVEEAAVAVAAMVVTAVDTAGKVAAAVTPLRIGNTPGLSQQPEGEGESLKSKSKRHEPDIEVYDLEGDEDLPGPEQFLRSAAVERSWGAALADLNLDASPLTSPPRSCDRQQADWLQVKVERLRTAEAAVAHTLCSEGQDAPPPPTPPLPLPPPPPRLRSLVPPLVSSEPARQSLRRENPKDLSLPAHSPPPPPSPLPPLPLSANDSATEDSSNVPTGTGDLPTGDQWMRSVAAQRSWASTLGECIDGRVSDSDDSARSGDGSRSRRGK
jgi:hypothetical protein